VSKVRWDIILTSVGTIAVILGILTEFSSGNEDLLYFGGTVAIAFGVSMWANRRRRLRNVPPPPVPVGPSEP